MDKNALVLVVGILISSALLLTIAVPFAAGLVVAVAVFSILWCVSLIVRNASIIDIFWGLGLIAHQVSREPVEPPPADGYPPRRAGLRSGVHLGTPPFALHRRAKRRRRRRFSLPQMARRGRFEFLVDLVLQGLPASGNHPVDRVITAPPVTTGRCRPEMDGG